MPSAAPSLVKNWVVFTSPPIAFAIDFRSPLLCRPFSFRAFLERAVHSAGPLFD